MKFLQKRPVAGAIAAVVMAASMLAGVHFSGMKQVNKTEAMFFNGTNSIGSTNTVAIDDMLFEKAQAALGMVSVAADEESLKSEVDTVRAAREMLLEANTINAKAEENYFLDLAVEQLAAKSDILPERLKQGFDDYLNEYSGAQTVIDQNTYNEKVNDFNGGVLHTFPMSFLRIPAFVRDAQRFTF